MGSEMCIRDRCGVVGACKVKMPVRRLVDNKCFLYSCADTLEKKEEYCNGIASCEFVGLFFPLMRNEDILNSSYAYYIFFLSLMSCSGLLLVTFHTSSKWV